MGNAINPRELPDWLNATVHATTADSTPHHVIGQLRYAHERQTYYVLTATGAKFAFTLNEALANKVRITPYSGARPAKRHES